MMENNVGLNSHSLRFIVDRSVICMPYEIGRIIVRIHLKSHQQSRVVVEETTDEAVKLTLEMSLRRPETFYAMTGK